MRDAGRSGPPGEAALPPGQRRLDFFPRFGRRLGEPPPEVGARPTVVVGGVVSPPTTLDVDAILAEAGRRVVRADFHCVAGWSVTDLQWDGAPFAAVYARLLAPLVDPGVSVTHVDVTGLDGEHFVAQLDDLLDDDVLLADRLDGGPLDGRHGAPLRLVSPRQYGYANVKHVCRIDLLAGAPQTREPLLDRLLASHPRARVWEEERHGRLPGRVVRPVYRGIRVLLLASARRRARARRSP